VVVPNRPEEISHWSKVAVRCYLLEVSLTKTFGISPIVIIWPFFDQLPVAVNSFSLNNRPVMALILANDEPITPVLMTSAAERDFELYIRIAARCQRPDLWNSVPMSNRVVQASPRLKH
jgi:hypothetical protein